MALTEITHATSVTAPLIGCQVTTYMHDKHVLCDSACVFPGAVYSLQNCLRDLTTNDAMSLRNYMQKLE